MNLLPRKQNAGRSFAEGPAEGLPYVHSKYEGTKIKTHMTFQYSTVLSNYIVQRLKNPFQYDFILLDLDWDWIEIGWLKRAATCRAEGE